MGLAFARIPPASARGRDRVVIDQHQRCDVEQDLAITEAVVILEERERGIDTVRSGLAGGVQGISPRRPLIRTRLN